MELRQDRYLSMRRLWYLKLVIDQNEIFLSSEDRKKANILKIITNFPKAHFGGGSFSSQQYVFVVKFSLGWPNLVPF